MTIILEKGAYFLAKQAAGLHKASGLDWHQPHGARAEGPCGVGSLMCSRRASTRANYDLSGPLQGPFHFCLLSLGHTDLLACAP